MKKLAWILTPITFFALTSLVDTDFQIPVKDFFLRMMEMSFPAFTFNFIPYTIIRLNQFNKGIHFCELSIFTVLIVFLILLVVRHSYKKRPMFNSVIHICLALVVVFISIRAVAQLFFIHQILDELMNKKTEEVNLVADEALSSYITEVKKVLPQRGKAIFLTGYTGITSMQVQMQLAYFLYPMDLRDIRGGDAQVYLIFNKADSAKYVPKDFKIIKQLDSHSLIAIKEDK